MRKGNRILQLERDHQRPISDLVVEALQAEGSIVGAARSLGVPAPTFYWWMTRLGIRLEKVVRIG